MEISNLFVDLELVIFLKLLAALFLGMSLGIERAVVGKTAGMRTYGLVAMGSALFVIVGVTAAGGFSSPIALTESLRFTAQVITGIGFIGAGLIFFKDQTVSGVTTAAGIWVASGVGMAIGYGLYGVAVMVTLLAFTVFTLLWYVEQDVKRFINRNDKNNLNL
jgi:putative Mg2+ transporter-C (MgtC) family protein